MLSCGSESWAVRMKDRTLIFTEIYFMSGTVFYIISDHKLNEVMKELEIQKIAIYRTCQKKL
jgi:hypothetical protein